MHRRLNTALRISRWNPTIDLSCRIYNSFVDSQNHLFGECHYVKELWTFVFAFLSKPVRFSDFDTQMQVMIRLARKRHLWPGLLLDAGLSSFMKFGISGIFKPLMAGRIVQIEHSRQFCLE